VTQVFHRRTELGVKLAIAAVFGGALVAFALLSLRGARDPQLSQPVLQPIPFSHKHHVSDDGIDCRYCHTTVETSAFAGMPTTHTCMTCHSQLYADAPMLAPLHRAAATGEPIHWKRVYKLPDFVYFNHSIHIAKGVGCVECHGRIDQMPLTWRASPMHMEWCLACHRNPAPHLRPHDQLFTMGAPPGTAKETAQLARMLRLESTRRLTDCSTCHR
jgi:hypothetical protein